MFYLIISPLPLLGILILKPPLDTPRYVVYVLSPTSPFKKGVLTLEDDPYVNIF